ncbi:hypothetical protein Taro_007289 [Colocasia esculenta]|uniref:Uncharacterized protein n=1 Tax=Colocasia esculenta TaxID=4460 RepID=A0A843TZT6_COLES|nr:hypothetical protein [Colocasia esculenta]
MWCVPLCLHGLWFGIPCEASTRSWEADSDQVRYWFNGLGRGVPPQLVSEQEISGMADRRDWGGGGDDPEESTQRMIERIWESLTDIRERMDQQVPVPLVAVPPGDGEDIPVAPVPLRVEASARSWEADSDQVRYWFNGLGRGVPPHLQPQVVLPLMPPTMTPAQFREIVNETVSQNISHIVSQTISQMLA